MTTQQPIESASVSVYIAMGGYGSISRNGVSDMNGEVCISIEEEYECCIFGLTCSADGYKSLMPYSPIPEDNVIFLDPY
ncbi:hypothetical protein [Aestuariivivens marinum]|uniref:hypothetical protein n=1 Tax=Aestuariivivens marinum TaxID=2913555 RepID=UPI001F58F444|nr:hypothetical protein [Aestuariivivens marinum]